MATRRRGLTASQQARTARGMRRDLARLSAGEGGGRLTRAQGATARAMQADMARLSGLTGRGVTKASGGSDRS